MKQHPEDLIYKTKTFINELQKVQESYFNSLTEEIGISKTNEDWLFDYIYNTELGEYGGFDEYLNEFNRKYEDVISKTI